MTIVSLSRIRLGAIFSVAVLLAATTAQQVFAQGTAAINYTYSDRAVGGVSVNAEGVLENVTADMLGKLAALRKETTKGAPADLQSSVELRKISLKALNEAIAESEKTGKPLPEEYKYLGGIQRIQYVLVYSDTKDIVLAGPGEGWKADDRGNVVGAINGLPTMRLDDLLTAFRTARDAAKQSISCSIDPTADGVRRLKEHASHLNAIGNPQETTAGIEKALGMQQITVTGVPGDSHYAQVLVAADYRMKRIAMNFESAPKGVKLPSFLEMTSVSSHGMSSMAPRWWLEPKYEPILRDADGMSFELHGTVQAKTEEDFFTQSGDRKHTGKANPMAQRWADLMTKQYEALSVGEPIFGELRNCIELAVVGALVVKESLPQKAGADLHALFDEPAKSERVSVFSGFSTAKYVVPKQVPSQASVLQKGRNWIISASGGVSVNSWSIADKTEVSDKVAPVRAKAQPKSETTSWIWN